MKKKILRLSIGAVVLAILYLSLEWYWLQTTQLLPYMNLKDLGSSSCYVYFNVKNQGKVYKVVMPNGMADRALVSRKSVLLSACYSFYMAEIIRYDLSIGVNDSLFSEIKLWAVDDMAVNKFARQDLLNDTLLLDKYNRLTSRVPLGEYNALIYTLLKNGSNCCVEDISGDVFVSR